MPSDAIPASAEFARVRDLPRRKWTEADADAWADTLTAELRARPGVTARLRRWQGAAIATVLETLDGPDPNTFGALLGLPVGVGKTLISALLPVALGLAESPVRRALLIVPSNLVAKTRADFASYVGVWKMAQPAIRIVGWRALTTEDQAGFFEDFKPDLIIVDEADEFANRSASVPARMFRYIDRARAAGRRVGFVAMSGTIMRKNITDFSHHLTAALGVKGAPIPARHGELLLWDALLGENNRQRKPAPGALGPTAEAAADWFASRLAETPGVLLVTGDSCDQPLTIHLRPAKEDPILDEAFKTFLVRGEDPSGNVIVDPLSRWRLDGQLGCGVVLEMDPPPPQEWATARRVSARVIRRAIERSQSSARPIDTEAQAIRRLRGDAAIEAWLDIRDTYDPRAHSRPNWITVSTLESAGDWLLEEDTPGIVWVGSVDFGHALADATGLEYYGPDGRERYSGRELYDPPVGRSIICSWMANKKGFNLQAWSRALVVYPPQSAKWLEQLIGRHHRSGQTCPVRIYVLVTSGGTLDAFDAALREARRGKRVARQDLKILRAEILEDPIAITESNQFRWATRRSSS